jgi:hypothetical protein
MIKMLKFWAEIYYNNLAQKCANNNISSMAIYKYYHKQGLI